MKDLLTGLAAVATAAAALILVFASPDNAANVTGVQAAEVGQGATRGHALSTARKKRKKEAARLRIWTGVPTAIAFSLCVAAVFVHGSAH